SSATERCSAARGRSSCSFCCRCCLCCKGLAYKLGKATKSTRMATLVISGRLLLSERTPASDATVPVLPRREKQRRRKETFPDRIRSLQRRVRSELPVQRRRLRAPAPRFSKVQ